MNNDEEQQQQQQQQQQLRRVWELSLVSNDDTVQLDLRLDAELAAASALQDQRDLAQPLSQHDTPLNESQDDTYTDNNTCDSLTSVGSNSVASVAGRRAVQQPSGGSGRGDVYKVSTLAAIAPIVDEDDPHTTTNFDSTTTTTTTTSGMPSVYRAVSSHNGLALQFDDQLHLLDMSCSSVTATLALDFVPDAVAYSSDAHFLALGDSEGFVHIFHVSTHRIVFSHAVTSTSDIAVFPVLQFTHNDTEGCDDLVVIAHNLTMLVVSGLQLGRLHTAIIEQDLATAQEIKMNVATEVISLAKDADSGEALYSAVNCATLARTPSNSFRFGTHETMIYVGGTSAGGDGALITCWKLSIEDGLQLHDVVYRVFEQSIHAESNEQSATAQTIKSLHITSTGRHLLALDNAGSLQMFDIALGVPILIRVLSLSDIVDFTALTTSNKHDSAVALIAALVRGSDSHGTPQSIQIIELPSGATRYSLGTSDVCHLVRLPSASSALSAHSTLNGESSSSTAVDGSVVFIEGRRQQTEDGSTECVMYLRTLGRIESNMRLQYLLSQHRYNEALELVKHQDGLNASDVYKEKLSALLNAAAHLPSTSSTSSTVQSKRRRSRLSTGGNVNAADSSSNALITAAIEALQDVDGLISDLRHVPDIDFAVRFCLDAPVQSFDAAYRLLDYAASIVQSIRLSRPANSDSATAAASVPTSHALRIHRFKQLLQTYRILVSNPSDGSLAYGSAFSSREWHRFRSASLLAEVQRLSASGRFDMAVEVWRRHADIDASLANGLIDFLTELPPPPSVPSSGGGVDSIQLVSWLRDEVLPRVENADTYTDLSIWAHDRAIMIAKCERRPHGALRLAELLIGNTSDSGNDNASSNTSQNKLAIGSGPITPGAAVRRIEYIAATASHGHSRRNPADSPLWQLHAQLSDLVYLWDKHGLQMQLDDYLSPSPIISINAMTDADSSTQSELDDKYDEANVGPRKAAFALLNSVPLTASSASLLSDAITAHFMPYVTRNSLSPDVLLSDYCQDLFAFASSSAAGGLLDSFASAVEARVLTIAQRISDLDTRLDVTIELAQRASIPWSNGVESLIDTCLATMATRRRIDELREHRRLMLLRRTAQRYGIRGFNVANTAQAKAAVYTIASTISPVGDNQQTLTTKTRTEIVMKDALQLVAAYNTLSAVTPYIVRFKALSDAGSFTNLDVNVDVDANIDIDAEIRSLIALAKNEECSEAIMERCRAWIDEALRISTATLTSDLSSGGQDEARHVSLLRAAVALNAPSSSSSSSSSSSPGYLQHRTFSALLALAQEFKLYLSPEHMCSESDKQSALRQVISRAMSSGSIKTPMQTIALARRLADVLGLDMLEIQVALAEAAARNAKNSSSAAAASSLTSTLVSSSSSLKAHSSASNPSIRIGDALSAVARAHLDAISEQVKTAGNGNDRNDITARLDHVGDLLSKAMVACKGESIGDLLDSALAVDQLRSIHGQTASGDYLSSIDDFDDIDHGFADGTSSQHITSTSTSTHLRSIHGQTASGDYLSSIDDFDDIDHGFADGTSSQHITSTSTSTTTTTTSNSSAFMFGGMATTSSSTSVASAQAVPTKSTPAARMEIPFGSELLDGSMSSVERALVMPTQPALRAAMDYVISSLDSIEAVRHGGKPKVHRAAQTAVQVAKKKFNGKGKGKGKAPATADAADLWSILSGNVAKQQQTSVPGSSEIVPFGTAANQLCEFLGRYYAFRTAVSVHQALFAQLARTTSSPTELLEELQPSRALVYFESGARHALDRTQHVDVQLALAYLIRLPPNAAGQIIQDGLRAADQSNALMAAGSSSSSSAARAVRCALTGAAYAQLRHQSSMLSSNRAKLRTARWSAQLALLDSHIQPPRETSSMNDAISSITRLLGLTALDLETAIEYAADAGLDAEVALRCYIHLVLISPTVLDYIPRVTGILEDIADKVKLVTVLRDDVVSLVSPYDYERLQYVFTLIQQLASATPDGVSSDPDNAVPELMVFARRGLRVLASLSSHSRVQLADDDERAEYSTICRSVSSFTTSNTSATAIDFYSQLEAPYSTRLPFQHLLTQPWDVLKAELDESTVARVLAIAQTLDISSDDVYCELAYSMVAKLNADRERQLALQQSGSTALPQLLTTSNSSTTGSSSAWNGTRVDTFKTILQNVRNPQVVISLADAIANALIDPDEHIEMLRYAATRAEKLSRRAARYVASNSNGNADAEADVQRLQVAAGKLRRKCAYTETVVQLERHGLSQLTELVPAPSLDEEMTNDAEETAEKATLLLNEIYEAVSADVIMTSSSGSSSSTSSGGLDYHTLANTIAARFGVNVMDVRSKLLDAWLVKPMPTLWVTDNERLPSSFIVLPSFSSASSSISSPTQQHQQHQQQHQQSSTRAQYTDELYDEPSLQRKLVYLLQAFQSADGSSSSGDVDLTLLQLAYKQSRRMKALPRLRALCILFQMYSTERINRRQNVNSIREYMKLLLFHLDMERLGVRQTMDEFRACDKAAFVRSLWMDLRQHQQSASVSVGASSVLLSGAVNGPLIAQLIVNLCIDYGIVDGQLIERALRLIISSGTCCDYVQQTLVHLDSIQQLCHIASNLTIWRELLIQKTTSFATKSVAASNDDERDHVFDQVLDLWRRAPCGVVVHQELACLLLEQFKKTQRLDWLLEAYDALVRIINETPAEQHQTQHQLLTEMDRIVQRFISGLDAHSILTVLDSLRSIQHISPNSFGTMSAGNSTTRRRPQFAPQSTLPSLTLLFDRVDDIGASAYAALASSPKLVFSMLFIENRIQTGAINYSVQAAFESLGVKVAAVMVRAYSAYDPEMSSIQVNGSGVDGDDDKEEELNADRAIVTKFMKHRGLSIPSPLRKRQREQAVSSLNEDQASIVHEGREDDIESIDGEPLNKMMRTDE
ncbi:hypothetical protein GQ42DRAFT_157795 [Ramicandelaber brevisporus]|nr:hypothetical protein GQ42DRAFT_157795 [Ramicandelaber brevisporus]